MGNIFLDYAGFTGRSHQISRQLTNCRKFVKQPPHPAFTSIYHSAILSVYLWISATVFQEESLSRLILLDRRFLQGTGHSDLSQIDCDPCRGNSCQGIYFLYIIKIFL